MFKTKAQKIINALSEGIYEKEEAIQLALLASVAGESIFLLGPPGVAKSLVARKLKFAFQDGKSFEYLMSRFSTPDEIFGPVSIKKLKDEDKYERLTAKYMPDANVVFLDEIWKASPAIQNALLTILNEKIYRNGDQDTPVQIHCILSASNELPSQGEGLDALWDRFLIRYEVNEIKNAGSFLKMITSTKNVYEDSLDEKYKISIAELQEWQQKIDEIEIPEEVLNTIQVIKTKLETYNHQQIGGQLLIYDRRWKKIIRLLRASAFLNDRSKVDLMDCFLMTHCLWNTPEQKNIIFQMISESIRQHGYTLALNLNVIKKEIQDFEQEVEQEIRIPYTAVVEELQSVDTEYLEILNIKNYFDGNLIKKADFVKLSLEETKSLSLYDSEHSLINKINAKLSLQPHTLDIFYNSQTIPLRLKTVEKEKTTFIEKKPHPLIKKMWEERCERLLGYIQQQKQHLTTETPVELSTLRNNIFVSAHLAEIVENNIKDVTKSLNSLHLQVEKIMHGYSS